LIARLELDLAALRANLRRLAALVAPTPLAPVVKANAYGHGLVPVARAAAPFAPMLCVYRLEEAEELRAHGVDAPLLILGPVEPSALERAHRTGAALTLWDSGSYRDAASTVARRLGRAFSVHVKIDTGVTRFGLDPARVPLAVAAMLDDPALRIDGMFTHLAAAEELESRYTRDQLTTFARCLQPLEMRLRGRSVLRHAAASAAAMLYPESRLDLVRPGIAVYGIWPSAEVRELLEGRLELQPALRWTTTLAAVREVEAGRFVGYGCAYRAPKATRIGVLPIGYAEGIPRAAGNRGAVLVDGRRAPIVGRVCMNVTMIDVGEIPAAHPGSTVTLLGDDGAESVGAMDWGDWSDSIAYEIVARLPAAIPRTVVDREAETPGLASTFS
jgi:alanine racemase